MVEHNVSANAQDRKLKSYIQDLYPGLKPSVLNRALQQGDIRVNGAREKRNVPLHEGDVLNIYVADDLLGVTPELEIVYEDENLMIVNKQPGISCYDDRLSGSANVLSAAEAHMKKTGEYDADLLNIPYLCHRLDHHTGGLLVIAKHEHAHDTLVRAFAERRVRKFYRAVVCGEPEPEQAQLHDFLLKDDAAARVKIFKSQVRGSLPVFTRYRTLKSAGGLSLLEIELVTGRTHQIRAHMAFYGYPVLGDDKYGDRRMNKRFNASWQALWACRLVFDLGTGCFLEYLSSRAFETRRAKFPESLKELGLEPF